jgi:2-keto-4-pentenoate hydratase
MRTETKKLSAAEIDAAARLLLAARRTGRRIDGLPEPVRPASVADGHAIQDRVLGLMGAQTGAIKVNAPPAGEVYRGIVESSRVFSSPARIPAADAGLMGVEAEVAFLFPEGVPGRAEPWGYDELAALARAMPAFDIVDSRLDDFMSRTPFERIADCLNAGAFVHGRALDGWRRLDLAAIEVTLKVDDRVIVRRVGGHPPLDPFVPALDYVNAVPGTGLPPGAVLTTGSFTGLHYSRSRQRIRAEFPGLGDVEVTFTP